MIKEVLVEVKKDKIFCDNCGRGICFVDEKKDSLENFQFKISGKIAFGFTYMSKDWEYNLCRKCTAELIDKWNENIKKEIGGL